MTSYHDKLVKIQQHGVLFHRCVGWEFEDCALICSQTGWLFFRGNQSFLKKTLEQYNIPVVYEYEGPCWRKPLPSWPEVSFEEAKKAREDYRNKWE